MIFELGFGFEKESVIFVIFFETAVVCDDHWRAVLHCFKRRQSEAFIM